MTAEEAQNEAKCVGSQQGKSAEKGKSGADKSYMGGYAEACEVGIQRCRTLAMQVQRRSARCARKRSGSTSAQGVKPELAA